MKDIEETKGGMNGQMDQRGKGVNRQKEGM